MSMVQMVVCYLILILITDTDMYYVLSVCHRFYLIFLLSFTETLPVHEAHRIKDTDTLDVIR